METRYSASLALTGNKIAVRVNQWCGSRLNRRGQIFRRTAKIIKRQFLALSTIYVNKVTHTGAAFGRRHNDMLSTWVP